MKNRHVIVILIVAIVIIATYFFIVWGVQEHKQAVVAQKTAGVAEKVIDTVVDTPVKGLKKLFE